MKSPIYWIYISYSKIHQRSTQRERERERNENESTIRLAETRGVKRRHEGFNLKARSAVFHGWETRRQKQQEEINAEG